jgi:hypothetical protein
MQGARALEYSLYFKISQRRKRCHPARKAALIGWSDLALGVAWISHSGSAAVAAAIIEEIARPAACKAVDAGGAARAAKEIAALF